MNPHFETVFESYNPLDSSWCPTGIINPHHLLEECHNFVNKHGSEVGAVGRVDDMIEKECKEGKMFFNDGVSKIDSVCDSFQVGRMTLAMTVCAIFD
jgi:hypothetical protein